MRFPGRSDCCDASPARVSGHHSAVGAFRCHRIIRFREIGFLYMLLLLQCLFHAGGIDHPIKLLENVGSMAASRAHPHHRHRAAERRPGRLVSLCCSGSCWSPWSGGFNAVGEVFGQRIEPFGAQKRDEILIGKEGFQALDHQQGWCPVSWCSSRLASRFWAGRAGQSHCAAGKLTVRSSQTGASVSSVM